MGQKIHFELAYEV